MNYEKIFENALSNFTDKFENFIEDNYSDFDQLGKPSKYALEGKGKRVRPLLVMLSNYAFDGLIENAIPAAIAMEMVHTYSLVHDDLPCMDNDDLRRGRPTTHKVFGEAEALLAGSALLTDAFSVLVAHGSANLTEVSRLQQVAELANASGSKGMLWGQSQDLYWTAKQGGTEEDIDDLHLAKTGALIGASCAMGAISAGATLEQIQVFRKFGKMIGLAFQIFDDLLDDIEGTGKSSGKDLELGKLTYLKFMNREEAKINAEQLTQAAIESIEVLNLNTKPLIEYCKKLLNRTH